MPALYFESPTTLNIEASARFGQRSLLGPLVESQLNARCIVVNYAGVKPVKFAGSANITAVVVAPNTTMKLGAFGDYRGTFVANEVQVGRSAFLEAALPLPTMSAVTVHATLGGMDIERKVWAVLVAVVVLLRPGLVRGVCRQVDHRQR